MRRQLGTARSCLEGGEPWEASLNVAVLAITDSVGFFVALHEGLFADEGLQVHYTPAYSDNIIAAQAKGKYDITGMNYVSYIQAQVHEVATCASSARARCCSRTPT